MTKNEEKLAMIREYLDYQGFHYIETEEEFIKYFKQPEGLPKLQPMTEPEDFPCMIKQECVSCNPDGADYAVLSIVELTDFFEEEE